VPRCPNCQSPRIVVVISPRPRAFCAACETRWVQEGSYQREIRPPARVKAPSPQLTEIRAS